MKLSKYHLPTIKEAPSEAEVMSHKLMLRAGMTRMVAAGIYTLLPLGVRVIRKVEKIIREEMDRAGALEVFMPSIQPSELWQESGRWEFYGKELLRITDRHGRDFCYGPTHEEVVTDLVRGDIRSYRQLPINLYQIQTKFRDEIRPRFGVMRGREFSMKDAYSFDATDEGANESYALMKKAYDAIFKRCGLTFRPVEADTGQIGGSYSHEFMVLAESGEDVIAYCHSCDYAANVERVELKSDGSASGEQAQAMEEISTPEMKAVGDVAQFLKASVEKFIKTLIFKTDNGELIAVLTRGDHEVNETKLMRAVGANEVLLASDEEVLKVTNAPTGFAGPCGLSVKIIADNAVKNMVNSVTGANKLDTHVKNVNIDRDFTVSSFADIRNAIEGDNCPRCDGGELGLARGVEVGHIFKLGTKYSEAMGATFSDADGNEKPMIMGCYGIGVGRTSAAAIEQNHDDNGIIWPVSIAPFEAVILTLSTKDEDVVRTGDEIYDKLLSAGVDTALDDRNIRAGVKFNDADLVGYPLQIIIGKKGLSNGNCEVKVRKTGEKTDVPLGEVSDTVTKMLKDLMD